MWTVDKTNRRQLLEFFERIRKQQVPNAAQISAFWAIAFAASGAKRGAAVFGPEVFTLEVSVPGMTEDSMVFLTVAGNDASLKSATALAQQDKFTIVVQVAPDTETKINWMVLPPTPTLD